MYLYAIVVLLGCSSDMLPTATTTAATTTTTTTTTTTVTATTTGTNMPSCEGQIVFPDENLVHALAQEPELLPTFDVTATSDELLPLTKVDEDSDEAGIVDLTGMQCLWNVEVINFPENSIASIDPLRWLSKLRFLNLNENYHISDISALAELADLQFLNLSENPITDISALVANQGIGAGDEVLLYDINLDCDEQHENLVALLDRGVDLHHDCGQF